MIASELVKALQLLIRDYGDVVVVAGSIEEGEQISFTEFDEEVREIVVE